MSQKKSSLIINLLCLSIIPLLILAAATAALSVRTFYASMESEVKNGLASLGHAVYMLYEQTADGEYTFSDGIFKKGDTVLSGDYRIVDGIKAFSGIDVTIFYGDTRAVTSIMNADGSRAVGTHAAEKVVKTVYGKGESYFSADVMVNGKAYFGYYLPITAVDMHVVGMVFVGKPRYEVISMINSIIIRMLWIFFIILCIVTVLCILYARNIIRLIKSVMCFLGEISQGNVCARFDPVLLERNDEIGEIGKFSVKLQSSMIELIGTDPLTGLYNRRSGGISLEHVLSESCLHNSVFCVAIGDIDSFKIINDGYGHTGGDQVLKKLAGLFKAHMENRGFVARWGGEEFLFVFEKANKKETYDSLQELLKQVRCMKLVYSGSVICTTMTFGIAEYKKGRTIQSLIQKADDNLYLGKRNKKDQVVV